MPTMALRSDRLPDGTSIRFPLEMTSVKKDQRGMDRLPMTCPGPVEFFEGGFTDDDATVSASITLYPNPATDVIYVQGAANFGFRITDIQGREVLRGETADGEINLSSLTPGIYSISFGNGGCEVFVKR